MQTTGTERVVTDAGEFDTVLSTVQSAFLDEIGLKEFRINFTSDEARMPVQIRFRTRKGEFKASLASVLTIQPDVQTEPTPTLSATPVSTPAPFQTPRVNPTPTPYVENQPLSTELPFALGETLNFKVTSQNQTIGTVAIQAKERRQVLGKDALLLTASVTPGGPPGGILNPGDSIKSFVDPLLLTPINLEMKLTGTFATYNQILQFEQSAGFATDNTTARFDMPVGTHSILSLAYAVRSFNLTYSKNPTNPVNDTRVAVFWKDKAYRLILRPLPNTETIEFEGRKVSTQVVSVSVAENPQFDQLNLKFWLSNDERRLPLRLVVGGYRAELLSVTQKPTTAKPDLP